ncbi:hypothetical protein D3C84_966120 [compost metagenome]
MHIAQAGREVFIQAKNVALHRQIHAGAKSPPRPGHQNHANLIIQAGALKGMLQLVRHIDGKRIHQFGAIECQPQQAIVEMPVQRCIVHRIILFSGVDRNAL